MTDVPPPPVPLAGAALAKWAELAPQLAARPHFRPAKMTDLAAYCAAFGRWHDAEEFLADPEHGPVLTIRDDKGNIKSHGPAPQLAIAERAAKELARLAKSLGL
jgi:phage terminase small subunit